MSALEDRGHAELMDRTYKHQRKIYDLTRRYYLLGRDHLIDELAPPEGGSVLEIACGTGRNLEKIDKRWPGRALYGFDISKEMLAEAQKRLEGRATLALADACAFDAQALFGCAQFDRIVLSYSLSMIPDWRGALQEAASHLAPGGRLHIVDFGRQERLPAWFRRGLRAWLAKFHVDPRDPLPETAQEIARSIGATAQCRSLYRGYAIAADLAR